MKGSRGFTLVEMVVASALFLAGGLYIYSTFVGVTTTTRGATVEIDLNSQNKRALTRLANELQATSLDEQDTDGVDSTDPIAVFAVEADTAAPAPRTLPREAPRAANPTQAASGEWTLGAGREQARERTIARSSRIRFRKVVGYTFNETAGTILPQWSQEITYRVDDRRRLVRETASGRPLVVAHDVDAFQAEPRPDGTVILTMVTAKRDPTGPGWRRYANTVTIHPKN